ncbi:MAG: ABC transporter permease [Lachnospiraceae bacterium]|jgi:putative ABC transport system permease protein|nr:ABC transporter permease [Lachnospiraceae bacterium]
MMTMQTLEKKLQKASRKQATLYLLCNFVSMMLITSYAAILFSPTILNVLPEGGDSRKQLYAIFVMALFGCVVFTIYAASLFFRKKSRQLGILMALGASKKRLSPGLFREVALMSGVSSLAGIAAGIPFVILLWKIFQLFIVDTGEMKLVIHFQCLYVSAAFYLLVSACACIMAYQYLRKTNILDVVQEEHKNEPVKELGRWCGPLGIVLIFVGAVAGYYSGTVYMKLLSAYPPAWLNITYAPVFIGLYLVMIHTVIHGWIPHKKKPYKNIISRSMMKFQGKQTVNSLIVSTVLIAGGCFAIFYVPVLATGQMMNINSHEYDYAYHYRADQNVPGKQKVTAMADHYGIALKDWMECPYITLGMDGYEEIQDENDSFHVEYSPLLSGGNFLSESSYRKMTGQDIFVPAQSYYAVTGTQSSYNLFANSNATKLTNIVTREIIDVTFKGYLHFDLMAGNNSFYVINDQDYEKIRQGLTPVWHGSLVYFNADGEDSYDFANTFFHTFVDSFGPECEYPKFYDPVTKIAQEEKGQIYWGDTDQMTPVSYEEADSSDFRLHWEYMPQFRILDRNDFMTTFSVYLMAFIFVALICFAAAIVIGYTRCQAIALNNRYVFDDLKRLGGPPAFLCAEVKRQCLIVFRIPAITGMTLMTLLYTLLLYANDSRLNSGELYSLLVCLGVLAVIAVILYSIYRYTVRRIERDLGIDKAQ